MVRFTQLARPVPVKEADAVSVVDGPLAFTVMRRAEPLWYTANCWSWTVKLPGLAGATSLAADRTTLAVTLPTSHHTYLLAPMPSESA